MAWVTRTGAPTAAQLARDLDVERHANFDAGRVAVGEGPSDTEERLVEVLTRAQERETAALAVALADGRVERVMGALGRAGHNFTAILAAARETLASSDKVLERERLERAAATAAAVAERERFRREHMLVRPATTRDPVLSLGIFLALLLGHAALDGALLAEVTRHGLLGGALMAGAMAAPTVALGTAMGLGGLRFLGHVRPARRVLGAVVTMVAGLALLGWVMLCGHLRVSLERAGTETGAVPTGLLAQMLTEPAAVLDHWQAAALVLLGLVAGAVAAFEGYAGITDPYPGYGAVERRVLAAEADERALLVEHEQARLRTLATALAAVEKHRERVERSGRTMAALLVALRRRQVEAEARLVTTAAAVREGLRLYREVFGRQRPAGELPARFAQPIVMAPVSLGPAADPTRQEATLRASLAEAHRAADAAVAALTALGEGAIDRAAPTKRTMAHAEEVVS
jgi:hypothetical protein